ncbi:hypothetical protein ACFYVL_02925 [Streptomyces sp. NPDC004111]
MRTRGATPIYDTVCTLWRLQNRELPGRPDTPGGRPGAPEPAHRA